MNDDEKTIAEAQAKLDARRVTWQREKTWSTPQRFAPPVSVVRPAPRIIRRPGVQRTASTELSLSEHKPGLMYVVPPPVTAPAPAGVEQRVREIIPEAFRDVTWSTLAALRNPEGGHSLGAVETEDGLLRGPAAVHDARRRMSGAQKVVIFGPTRAGKTLLAMAALEHELRRGNDRARWVHAPTLRDPDVMAKALASTYLLLDDLGYELDGAPEGSGWLSQKRGPACELLGRWYLRRDVRLVVTTFLGTAKMNAAYGEGATARVYEGAAVIKLVKE